MLDTVSFTAWHNTNSRGKMHAPPDPRLPSHGDDVLRLFFATDIHGSTLCFKKFLDAAKEPLAANVLLLGGDISSKELLFLVEDSRGGVRVENYDRPIRLHNENEISEFAIRAENIGKLLHRCTEDEYQHFSFSENLRDELCKQKRIERLQQWLELANSKLDRSRVQLIINCGNDDEFYLDSVLDSSDIAERPEGKILQLPGGIELASCGYSIETPWECPRDKGIDEDALQRRLEPMLQQLKAPRNAIFNFHCPPHSTMLDVTAKLDKNRKPVMGPLGIEQFHAGSTSIRKAIQIYKPALSLHGHIHGQHCHQKIGETVCYNPGSHYEEGLLNGVFAVFDKDGRLQQHTLISDSKIAPSAGFKAALVSILESTVIFAPVAKWMTKQDQADTNERLRKEISALREELKHGTNQSDRT